MEKLEGLKAKLAHLKKSKENSNIKSNKKLLDSILGSIKKIENEIVAIEKEEAKKEKDKKPAKKEARKKESKPKKEVWYGSGSSDVARDKRIPAKPIGYRFKGTGVDDYKTPTKEEISKGMKDGSVYWEGRKNRADRILRNRFEEGGNVSAINWQNFTLNELSDYIKNEYSSDIELNTFSPLKEVETNSGTEFKQDDFISIGKISKKDKDESLSIGYAKQIEATSGSENVYLNIVVYRNDSDKPFMLSIYTKEDKKGIKELASEIIEKFAEGGNIEEEDSLRHFVASQMSSGMLANKTKYSDYKTIDAIRAEMISILNKEGDRQYSMKAFADLAKEAEFNVENEEKMAKGGSVKKSTYDFDELISKEKALAVKRKTKKMAEGGSIDANSTKQKSPFKDMHERSVVEGKDVEFKDFRIGDFLEVRGWVMLKGVDSGFYKIIDVDNYPSITFVKCNDKGKVISKKKLRFPLMSIVGKFANVDWDSNYGGNGIRLIKYDVYKPLHKFAEGGSVGDEYINKKLRSVKVSYSNGEIIATSMAAHLTDEEILNYFKIGKVFNIGNVKDNLQKVTKVEILDKTPKFAKGGSIKRTKNAIDADKNLRAMPKGERVSHPFAIIRKANGETFKRRNANQFGEVEGDGVYTENRANRTDKDQKKRFAEGGNVEKNINKKVLSFLSQEMKDEVLSNVAKHYKISKKEVLEEVTDNEAERLYEYIANNPSLRMDIYDAYNYINANKFAKGGSIKRTKNAIDADKNLRAMPKGERVSHPFAIIRKANGETFKRRNANQFGEVEGDGVYTENRANRTDKDQKKRF